MRAVAVVVCFVCATVNIYAEVKWIPIEPLPFNETPKHDSNRSTLHSPNPLLENIKIMRRLLDTTSKDDLNAEDKKNWYSLDSTVND